MMTKLEKVLTFSCRWSTGKAEMQAQSREQPLKHFSTKKTRGTWKSLWKSPARSAKCVFPSCPQAIILSPPQEGARGLLATENGPHLSDSA